MASVRDAHATDSIGTLESSSSVAVVARIDGLIVGSRVGEEGKIEPMATVPIPH
jgi:hypothetical protein